VVVDGGANLLQETDDEGRGEGLLVRWGGDVDGVGASREVVGVEVGVRCVVACGVGVVGGEHAGGGGEDGGALPLVGLGDPNEHVAGGLRIVVFERAGGGVEVLTQYPAQDIADGPLGEARGV
jgi:hypothetical protein